MSATLRRLRRQHPYLTPGFFPDDEDGQRDLLNRFKLPRIPIPVEDGAEVAAPEFGEPYGTVPALRRPLADIDRIANLGEANPLPMPESDVPLLSRSLQMPQPRPQPPTVTYDQGGRPTSRVFGGTDDPEQRTLARRRALESYQPQKESVKKLLLRAGLNTILGGLPATAQTLLGQGGVLDRRGVDEQWKQRELSGVYGQLDRTRADRRAAQDDEYRQSQIDENRAQTVRTLREPVAPPVKPPAPTRRIPPVQQVDEAGNEYLADAETGEPLLDAKGERRYTGRAKAAPDVKPGKPDTSASQREAIQANIAAAEAEKKTLGPAPPPTYKESWGEVKVNSAYEDWARRYRQLDDDIRKWKQDLSKLPSTSTAPRVNNPMRSSGLTEQAIRDAAKAKNLDPEQAVKRARSRGMIR